MHSAAEKGRIVHLKPMRCQRMLQDDESGGFTRQCQRPGRFLIETPAISRHLCVTHAKIEARRLGMPWLVT